MSVTRGHLPVPVESRVQRPGGQRGHRSRRGAPVEPVKPDPGGGHGTEEQHEQRKPHEAELGSRLEIERVGVTRGVGAVRALEPLDDEAAGSRSGERVLGKRVERDLPVAVASALDRSEPFRGRAGRRGLELRFPLERRDGYGGERRDGNPRERHERGS